MPFIQPGRGLGRGARWGGWGGEGCTSIRRAYVLWIISFSKTSAGVTKLPPCHTRSGLVCQCVCVCVCCVCCVHLQDQLRKTTRRRLIMAVVFLFLLPISYVLFNFPFTRCTLKYISPAHDGLHRGPVSLETVRIFKLVCP